MLGFVKNFLSEMDLRWQKHKIYIFEIFVYILQIEIMLFSLQAK